MDTYASRHRVLYAAATCGGAHDDRDAIVSALGIMAVAVAERFIPEAEREARLRARIVSRIREGAWDEADVAWLQKRAAAMTDAEVLRMAPFDEAMEHEISRLVARASTPQVDHWTRRPIPPGQRHMVLREHLRGRENETRHSELSACLHVVAADGGAAEFLDAYDEAIALTS